MSLTRSLQILAQRAVQQTGTDVILRRVTVGAYNTATGTASTTTSDQELKARVSAYNVREFRDTVKVGDRKLYVAALDLDWEPTPQDHVLIADAELDIIDVQPMMATDAAAFYVLQVRG